MSIRRRGVGEGLCRRVALALLVYTCDLHCSPEGECDVCIRSRIVSRANHAWPSSHVYPRFSCSPHAVPCSRLSPSLRFTVQATYYGVILLLPLSCPLAQLGHVSPPIPRAFFLPVVYPYVESSTFFDSVPQRPVWLCPDAVSKTYPQTCNLTKPKQSKTQN